MKVQIFIGSESDQEIAQEAWEILRAFGVPCRQDVTSAHRSPERTLSLIKKAEEGGAEVFICLAGKAAHLAGVVAAHTVRPVIGVPVETGGLGGLDALLSTVQMPKGVPVATMGLGKTGAANAALLAVQILSLKDSSLRTKLERHREEMASQVEKASEKVSRKE